LNFQDYSFTALWAQISERLEGIFGKGHRKLAPTAEPLPEAELEALAARLEPIVAELEQMRQQTVMRVDDRARLWVPVAGGGAVVLVLTVGGGMLGALVLGAGAALAAWIYAQHHDAQLYSNAVKSAFGEAVAGDLSGFSYDATPEADPKRLASWRLFPELRSTEATDRMTGTRDGRAIALMRLTVAYGQSGGKYAGSKNKRALSATVLCVEVATGPGAEGVTVIAPLMSDSRLRDAPERKHGLVPISSGDIEFDRKFRVFASEPEAAARLLDASMISRIEALEAEAQDRLPFLVFMPGYLAVLYPVPPLTLSFTPGPFWVPLDGKETLASFASDLAVKHSQLVAALAIGPGIEDSTGPLQS